MRQSGYVYPPRCQACRRDCKRVGNANDKVLEIGISAGIRNLYGECECSGCGSNPGNLTGNYIERQIWGQGQH